jgi:RNA polymerase sigma-70 factor (ECF subfamily)
MHQDGSDCGSHRVGSSGERSLIAAAKGGDRDAMGQLLESCRNYLLLLARQEMPSDIKGKLSPSDVVQESCVEAAWGVAGFNGQTRQALLGWLRQIVLHNLADQQRWHRREKRDVGRETPLEDIRRCEQGIELPSDHTSPSGRIQAEESFQSLHRAVSQLPEEYRLVIMMHHREGLSFEDIAQRMERSVDAVRKLWYRAVRQLRAVLEPEDGRG